MAIDSPPENPPLISLKGVGLQRGSLDVLHGIDLDIAPAEILTIIGPNGAGKSSLAKIVAGLIPPTSGHIHRRHHLRMGYVPQDFSPDFGLPISVRRFLDLPRRLSQQEAEHALDMMSAGHLIQRPLARLSGGERQRVLIALALAGHPDLLVLDEPTHGLDPVSENDLYARLPALRDKFGFAVLMISHDLHVVMSATDRVLCLNRHVCCQGSPNDMDALEALRTAIPDPGTTHMALYHHRPHRHHPQPQNHENDHARLE